MSSRHARQHPPAPPVAVVAHRGASAYAPENTLSALRLGMAMAADQVEVDVRRTADGELVVVHDDDLARTTDAATVFPGRRSYRVGDCTLAELRQLDAGSWKADAYAGEPIPTLAEVLDAVQGTGVGLLLEAKEPAAYPGIGSGIRDLLHDFAYWRDADERQLLLVSFDADFLTGYHALAPQTALGYIGTPRVGELPAIASWARFVNPEHTDVTEPLVAAIHGAGLATYAWTTNDSTEMQRAVRAGVDGVVTDHPDLGDLLPSRRAA